MLASTGLERRGLVGEHAGRVQFRGHVREHELNRLVVGDRLSKRLPRLRVADRHLERRVADAEGLGGDGHPAAFEGPHRHLEAVVHRPDDMTCRHPDAGKRQVHAPEAAHAQRVDSGVAIDARRAHRHQERRDAVGAHARTRRREHEQHAGAFGVGHPRLPPVEGVGRPAVDLDGRHLQVRGVSSRVLLGERERPDCLPGGQRPQPLRFLGVRAEPSEHFADQRLVHDQDGGERGARPRYALDGQRVADVLAAAAAPRHRDRHSGEPVRAGQRHERRRELAGLVNPRRRGPDVRIRERGDVRLKRTLGGGEIQVHASSQ